MKASSEFRSAASMETLAARSRIVQQIRSFFLQREFFEVQTPLLSQESVIDLYLDPIVVPSELDGATERFLQTSPEFGMKRLLASGAEAIFQMAQAFRAGELGPMHNPEFTMLEWYRVGDDYEKGRRLLSDFADCMFQGFEIGTRLEPSRSCKETTFREAFLTHAKVDPFAQSTAKLLEMAQALGLMINAKSDMPSDDSDGDSDGDFGDEIFMDLQSDLLRRDVVNFLWATLVDPHLGKHGPEIVFDWPASEAALARTTDVLDSDGLSYAVAQRFELYFAGVELANGYYELLDADVLAARNQKANRQRSMTGKRQLPANDRLLAAMQSGFPQCSGVALGVDRLAMVLLGKTEIQQVLAFAWEVA